MSSCSLCFEFTGIFSKQLQTEVIWFLNALAIGMISLLCIQMRNFPVRVQPLVAMFSHSGGKSAFLCGGIGTASKDNTLQAESSALWKEAKRFFKAWESFSSYVFKQWCFRVQKRVILSHGIFVFFWNEYSKIVYSWSCKTFHRSCTENKKFSPCSFHLPGEFAHCRWAVCQTFAGIVWRFALTSVEKLFNLVAVLAPMINTPVSTEVLRPLTSHEAKTRRPVWRQLAGHIMMIEVLSPSFLWPN